MRFFKYEGLGNDFILIPQKPCLAPEQIRKLCDRQRGIGADGILFVFEEANQWNMKVLNADGSPAEMCGNGLRCSAQWLHDKGKHFREIKTDSGDKLCQLQNGLWICDMGFAQVNDNQVNTGNPHLLYEGPVNEKQINPDFNTEFVEVIDSQNISVRVFERGAGETLACGTGACAATAWLVHHNKLKPDTEITVHLKGGKLYVTVRQINDGLHLTMTGPAKYVFRGEV